VVVVDTLDVGQLLGGESDIEVEWVSVPLSPGIGGSVGLSVSSFKEFDLRLGYLPAINDLLVLTDVKDVDLKIKRWLLK